MGILARFEKKVEGAVNGVFARAFKGDVQPVEISARLQRELDGEAKLMSRDKRLVPNEFQVGLSQHDHDKLSPYGKALTTELAGDLRSYAQNLGYVFNGPIKIILQLDSKLPTGRFTVASRAVAGVEAQRPPAPPPVRPASGRQLVLEVNGTRHPLRPPGMTIGRGSEANLRISDPSISRLHAEIRVTESGDGQKVEIVDLGSTNGMTVNGQKVSRSVLGEGSRIQVGSTRMLVHAPAGH
jgi:FHA domain-containing protein